MTTRCLRTAAAAALVATSLLLAACSSGAPSSTDAATKSFSTSSHAVAAGAAASAAPTITSGSTSPAGAAGPAPAACTLITEKDAGTALEADPGPGTEITPGHCVYGGDAASVNVVVQPITGGSVAFQRLRAAMGGAGSVDVSGVGAEAFGVFTGSMGVVEFYQGESLVSIALSVDGASGSLKGRTIVLARAATGRV